MKNELRVIDIIYGVMLLAVLVTVLILYVDVMDKIQQITEIVGKLAMRLR